MFHDYDVGRIMVLKKVGREIRTQGEMLFLKKYKAKKSPDKWLVVGAGDKSFSR
jgi:hypothetical protein